MVRFSPVALGLSVGVVYGLVMVVTGLAAMYLGVGGEIVDFLGKVYTGYAATFVGSIIGGVYGLVYGFVVGGLVGWFYNKFSDRF